MFKLGSKSQVATSVGLTVLAVLLFAEVAHSVITLQIGGATRLGSVSRTRDRYSCYWDCDLVGCQIARDDDECAYDCEKICRVRYDYAGRSAEAKPEPSTLNGKSDTADAAAKVPATDAAAVGEQLETVGHPVRLHLPRNVSARNFGIWERCGQESGKPFEASFSI